MTVPVINALAQQYPDTRITVLSRAWAKPIFKLLPPNVHFLAVDFDGKYKGFSGLNLLCRKLMALRITHVADLHDVLRTKWLRIRLKITGKHVAHINKNRKARKEFIKAADKKAQKTTFAKYAEVFARLGYPIAEEALTKPVHIVEAEASKHPQCIAIAPFAAHTGKIYPLELMEQVVKGLSESEDVQVYLFGAGATESATLEQWEQKCPNVKSLAGKLQNMAEELEVIARCRVMISMDSANMHLASLAGVPVVSVWGATHPLGGFFGYSQDLSDAVQRTDLNCRPCSTYGQKPCIYGDYRCMTGILPQTIITAAKRHLQ